MLRRNETGNGRFAIAGAGSVNCMRSVVLTITHILIVYSLMVAISCVEGIDHDFLSGTRRSSSSRPRGIRRWVERCCPSTQQARRSEIPSRPRAWSMHWRRREGLRSFPVPAP